MKTIYIIESAEELLKFACRTRAQGNKSPTISNSAKLVFDAPDYVRLDGDPSFKLSEELSKNPAKIINAMAQRCDFGGADFA